MLYEFTNDILFGSSLVKIIDFRCWKVETGRLLPEEQIRNPSVVFPRRGVFHFHGGGAPVLGDPNQVIFFNANQTFRISYPQAAGDDSTIIVLSAELLDELVEHHGPRSIHDSSPRFPASHGLSDPKLFLRHNLLFDDARRNLALDRLRVEERAIQLAAQAITSAPHGKLLGPARTRSATRRAHREIAAHAQILLAERFRTGIELQEFARALGASPYHLCRLFARQVGMPIHRYQNRLRLRAALPIVAEAKGSLTELALELGYSSHSHFTTSFKREFGLPPSAFRQGATMSRLATLERSLERNARRQS